MSNGTLEQPRSQVKPSEVFADGAGAAHTLLNGLNKDMLNSPPGTLAAGMPKISEVDNSSQDPETNPLVSWEANGSRRPYNYS